jgi:ABC-type glycerol-3-phosphate transport system permease component
MKTLPSKIVLYTLLWMLVVITVVPFLFMALGGFKENYEILTIEPRLLPQEGFDLRKFEALLDYWPFQRNMYNSVIVASLTTVAAGFFCGLAGYAFAKFKFPGKDVFFIIVLASMMIPISSRIVPSYIVVRALGGINTYWALIVPIMVPPFGIFMVRQYAHSGIPEELLESGRLEGASEWYVFIKLVMPLMTPILISLGILTFMRSWNEFLWPLVVVTRREMFTVTVALRSLSDVSLYADYGIILAAATLSALPIILMYAFAHRKMIQGIIDGSGKET